MTSFAAAIELGVEWVETDVHATADGVLIAFHDDVLDRVTDGSGRVADLTWDVVGRAKINGTEPIPTLREVLTTWPALKVNIDVKSAGAIEPLAAVINELGAHERVRIASFSDARRRAALHQLTKPAASSPGQNLLAVTWIAARWPRLGSLFLKRFARDVDALQIPWKFGKLTVCDRRLIRAAHGADKAVHVWTVNDPAEMTDVLDLGVDALITDRADVAQHVISTRELSTTRNGVNT